MQEKHIVVSCWSISETFENVLIKSELEVNIVNGVVNTLKYFYIMNSCTAIDEQLPQQGAFCMPATQGTPQSSSWTSENIIFLYDC